MPRARMIEDLNARLRELVTELGCCPLEYRVRVAKLIQETEQTRQFCLEAFVTHNIKGKSWSDQQAAF